MKLTKKVRFLILSTGLLITLTVLLAMQFLGKINWTLNDFIIAIFLLGIAIFSIELSFLKIKKIKHRIIFSLLIIVFIIFIWIELAVGILFIH